MPVQAAQAVLSRSAGARRRRQQREQGGHLQRALGRAELVVGLLEEPAILEAEEHLRAQHQHARFVEGVLDPARRPAIGESVDSPDPAARRR